MFTAVFLDSPIVCASAQASCGHMPVVGLASSSYRQRQKWLPGVCRVATDARLRKGLEAEETAEEALLFFLGLGLGGSFCSFSLQIGSLTGHTDL